MRMFVTYYTLLYELVYAIDLIFYFINVYTGILN